MIAGSDTLCIGRAVVRTATNEFVLDGETRRLEHKVMRLFVFLGRNAGRDLSKEEILRGVWGEGVHNDEVLTVAVSSLRKALGDDAQSPTYIKTIPRYGYHMLVRAEESADAEPGIPGAWSALAERTGPRFLVVASLIAFFLLIVLVQVIVEIVHVLGN